MKQYAGRRKQQGGFSLVELILVIAVIAILGAIALQFFGGVSSSARAKNLTEQMQYISAQVKKVNPGQSYTGLTTQILIDNKKVPDGMINAANNGLSNDFGGSVAITPSQITGGQADGAFQIAVTLVPKEVCSEVVNSLVGPFKEIDVNGTGVKTSAQPRPTAAQVTTACSVADSVTINLRGTGA